MPSGTSHPCRYRTVLYCSRGIKHPRRRGCIIILNADFPCLKVIPTFKVHLESGFPHEIQKMACAPLPICFSRFADHFLYVHSDRCGQIKVLGMKLSSAASTQLPIPFASSAIRHQCRGLALRVKTYLNEMCSIYILTNGTCLLYTSPSPRD